MSGDTPLQVEPKTSAAIPVGREFIGDSPSISAIKELALSIASRRSTVMILGETGTGKEMLARFIHSNSDRARKPFVPVDCSSLAEGLFESELFGHVKGAFTGAMRDSLGFIRAADGGTLFLDEIGELALPAQAKLLRVIQERVVNPVGDTRAYPVDIRIIVATNRNPQEMAQAGTFRQDLLFRLNVLSVNLPPLRERVDDVINLAEHFLRAQAAIYNEQTKILSPEAIEALRAFPWPGNVRELANVIEHAHVVAGDQLIQVDDLPPRVRQCAPWGELSSPEQESICAQCPYRPNGESCIDQAPGSFLLVDVERAAIIRSLEHVRFCKAAAARLLGINIQRLNRRISRLGITLPNE